MEIVKFNSPEEAVKVQAHLHNVTVVGSELHHIEKFDKAALGLATRLEGLTQNDYQISSSFIEHHGDNSWFYRPGQLAQTTLDIVLTVAMLDNNGDIDMVGAHRYGLSVDPDFQITNGFNEIPLIMNRELVRFADIVQRAYAENTTDIVSEIAVAYCQVDDFRNPSQYHLMIRGGGRSQTIRFYPSQASFNISLHSPSDRQDFQ